MKQKLTTLTVIIMTLTLFIGCNKEEILPEIEVEIEKTYEEKVIVANREGKSISFIDAATNEVETITIAGSEPMYVVYVPVTDKIYVGDRAKNEVHIINPDTKSVESSIKVGNGVFHMWAGGNGEQLWVNNDVDKTVSVINLNTNKVVKTIELEMKPHDVFVTRDGKTAYVSVLNSDEGERDRVLMYSTETFEEKGKVEVEGKDPHLFHLDSIDKLFVPCATGYLFAFNGSDLSPLSNERLIGAHGIYPSSDQKNIFVTNTSGGKIYSVDAATGKPNLISDFSSKKELNVLPSAPHNIVLNEAGDKMFISHSGDNNTLTTYDVDAKGGVTDRYGEEDNRITVGLNPFGLTYYKRAIN